MKNIFLFFLLVTSNVFSQQENPGSYRVDSLFISQKDPIATGFSGVVLIAENGKPIYHKAFGYREFADQIPLQATDIFELASVSNKWPA